jgi:HEAT repeat protein
MGPKAKDAVPALAKALKDNDPKVRKKAAQALRELAAGARDAAAFGRWYALSTGGLVW